MLRWQIVPAELSILTRRINADQVTSIPFRFYLLFQAVNSSIMNELLQGYIVFNAIYLDFLVFFVREENRGFYFFIIISHNTYKSVKYFNSQGKKVVAANAVMRYASRSEAFP